MCTAGVFPATRCHCPNKGCICLSAVAPTLTYFHSTASMLQGCSALGGKLIVQLQHAPICDCAIQVEYSLQIVTSRQADRFSIDAARRSVCVELQQPAASSDVTLGLAAAAVQYFYMRIIVGIGN